MKQKRHIKIIIKEKAKQPKKRFKIIVKENLDNSRELEGNLGEYSPDQLADFYHETISKYADKLEDYPFTDQTLKASVEEEILQHASERHNAATINPLEDIILTYTGAKNVIKYADNDLDDGLKTILTNLITEIENFSDTVQNSRTPEEY